VVSKIADAEFVPQVPGTFRKVRTHGENARLIESVEPEGEDE